LAEQMVTAALLVAMCIASVPEQAQAPDTVQFEHLTWTQIRGAVESGKGPLQV
jgi:hypothetical protein